MTVEKDFPNPPGGKLICEDGQTAVIRITASGITASCHSPPGWIAMHIDGQYTEEYKNWTLEIVTERPRSLTRPLSFDDEAIFEAGRYEYVDWDGTQVRVEFRMPQTLLRPRGGTATAN